MNVEVTRRVDGRYSQITFRVPNGEVWHAMFPGASACDEWLARLRGHETLEAARPQLRSATRIR